MAEKKNNSFKSVDKISQELDVVDNFVLRNWKRYTYITIGVVIVVAAVLFFYESKTTSSVQESQEIITAKTIPELQDVIKKFPRSKSVDYSRLNLAAKYFDEKEYDKALDTYKQEISDGKDMIAVNIAKLNENYVLDIKGDKDNAVTGFEKIADDQNIPEFIRAEASYSAGSMLLNMNKKEEALKYLNLCNTFKNSNGWNKIAKGLIDNNS